MWDVCERQKYEALELYFLISCLMQKCWTFSLTLELHIGGSVFSLFALFHFFILCLYFASLHDPLLAARLVELGLALSSTLDCTSVDQFYLYLHFFCTLYFMISFLVQDFLNLDMLSAWPWIAQIGGSVFSWFATQWIIRAPINHIRPCTWMQLIQMEISAALFQSRTETYLLDCLRQGKSLEK